MIALLLGLASGGELGELARLGKPSMVATCEDVEAMGRLGGALGMRTPQGAKGPVHLAVLGRGDAPSQLVMELGAEGDPHELASRIAADDVGRVEVSVEGARVRMKTEHTPAPVTADPTVLAVRAMREQAAEGCAVAMVFAGAPGLSAPALVSFTFSSWEQPVHGTVDLPGNAVVDLLLDGEGEDPGLHAHSVHQFESAFQLHGTLPEAAFAMASLDPESIGPAMAMLGVVPRRLQVARGTTLGFDGEGRAWGAAVPLHKPATAKKTRRLLLRALRRTGMLYAEIGDGRFRVTPFQGPPVLIGLDDGLLVMSTRDDVVQDLLSGAGEPWIAAGDEAYGLRLRVPVGEGWLRTEEGRLRFRLRLDPDALGSADD
ncbi:MAG: hypothetical protein EP330_03055 [Deltaproteobacteria bacterium]|nr:MAG: hypothetical protein EP330_03055 [Deltaproteobacteria bacterium]